MRGDKTLITHAHTQKAKFLNYAVSIYLSDDKLSRRSNSKTLVRSINGKVRLGVPFGLIDEACKRYQVNGKVVSDPTMLQSSDASILNTFQLRYRGLVNYYQYAVDRKNFGKLKNAMQIALVKTLAHKMRIKVTQVYQRYGATTTVNGQTYRVLQVEIPTEKRTYTYTWGGIPLKTVKIAHNPLQDGRAEFDNPRFYGLRSDLISRIQANQCELCGSSVNCQVHHVRKLIDLKRRWAGRKEKPMWISKMIALQRKTLIVCEACHHKIHAGQPTNRRVRI
jgi:hypothetical protein